DFFRRRVPRQRNGLQGKLVLSGKINERWQQRPGPNLPGLLQLRDRKIHDRRIPSARRFNKRDRAVGRAEVNADEKFAHAGINFWAIFRILLEPRSGDTTLATGSRPWLTLYRRSAAKNG